MENNSDRSGESRRDSKVSRRFFLKLLGAGTAGLALSTLPKIDALKHTTYGRINNYYVFEDTYDYKAKNGITGEIEYTNTEATPVAQYALNSLTSNRSYKERVKLGGRFVISKLTIPSFTILDLSEAKILQANATNDFLFVNSDTVDGNNNIDVVGGYVDGNKSGQSAGGSDDTNSVIHLSKCADCRIVDGTYVNGNFHQIRIRDSSNVIVDRCFSKNPRHEHVSIHGEGKSSGIAKDCRVTNCSFTGIDDASGFPGETFVSTVNVEDVIIANNVCDTTSNVTSGLTPNGLRTIVANNTLRNVSGPGIILSQSTEADFDASGSVITGNLIKNSNRYAIMIDAYTTRDVIISNNIVDGVVETTYGGIYVSAGHRNIVITSNIVHNCGGSGINVHGTEAAVTRRIKISNNTCYNNGVSLSTMDDARSGIRVSGDVIGSVLELNIQDNVCFDDQNKKTQKFGIRLTNTNNTIVRLNDIRNNLTAGVSRVGDVGTILADNVA